MMTATWGSGTGGRCTDQISDIRSRSTSLLYMTPVLLDASGPRFGLFKKPTITPTIPVAAAESYLFKEKKIVEHLWKFLLILEGSFSHLHVSQRAATELSHPNPTWQFTERLANAGTQSLHSQPNFTNRSLESL